MDDKRWIEAHKGALNKFSRKETALEVRLKVIKAMQELHNEIYRQNRKESDDKGRAGKEVTRNI